MVTQSNPGTRDRRKHIVSAVDSSSGCSTPQRSPASRSSGRSPRPIVPLAGIRKTGKSH